MKRTNHPVFVFIFLSLFFETYGLKAIENTPVISIENYGMSRDSAYYPLKENLLRVFLKYDHNKTIKTAFELIPDHKNVYLICGASALDE